ncbi:hypothetical protein [Lewinella sp. IMCC34191]|uniref:hypothetical protein n=1 Tax=Lewinella sp. IMCC34191 TaxID=2259172 RepID=UPI000E286B5C|nr:hypothetical protein [Lewinella sp. IMCC34191]
MNRLTAVYHQEIRYQLGHWWTWLIALALMVIVFLLTRDGALAEALYDDFFVNSPFSIAKGTVVGTLLWLVIGAAVAGEAAARDLSTGIYPLVYTTSVSRRDYLGGKFLAALSINLLLLSLIQVATLLAVYLPGVDPEVIGPFRPAAFLAAYFYLSVPNVLAATALQFYVAGRSGRPMGAYLASLLLFVLSYFVATFIGVQGYQDVAKLLDLVGVHFVLSDLSHQWTPTEKSYRLLALEGPVLTNRLLWIGIAIAAGTLTYSRFRFTHRASGGIRWRFWRRKRSAPSAASTVQPGPLVLPAVDRTFDTGTTLRQIRAVAAASYRFTARSWAGRVLLIVIPLVTAIAIGQNMVLNGVPVIPSTALVLDELTSPLTAELGAWVLIPLLTIYLAGELVWREREQGIYQLTDTLPASGWVPVLGKYLGLVLVLALFALLQCGAGMAAQALAGYYDFEPHLYLFVLLGLQLPEYLLFAALALSLHALANHKYIGHLVAVLAYVHIVVPFLFGVEHPLLIFSAGPRWTYSEMLGFGRSLPAWALFKLYWVAWALFFLVLARLFWTRGLGDGAQVKRARQRLRGSPASVLVFAAGGVLAFGSYLLYDMHVRNDYRGTAEAKDRQAQYERRYARYAKLPQPKPAATDLQVDIFPNDGALEISGHYVLINGGDEPIDTLIVSSAPNADTKPPVFDRQTRPVVEDADLDFRSFVLDRPLLPGDSLRMDFRLSAASAGLTGSGFATGVEPGASLFTNAYLPKIGYDASREILPPSERREYDLPPRPLVPSLFDGPVGDGGRRGGSALSVTMGTAAGQVAVAPGELVDSWNEDGRSYYRYVTSAPIGGEIPFYSADYAIREARREHVGVRLYHHPAHTRNVERVMESALDALSWYSAHFGPYPYDHLTIVERSGDGTGMHADASIIRYTEKNARWDIDDAAGTLDLPYVITAHEMGHQWNLPAAMVEGAPVLSEGLAWYNGIRLTEQVKGRKQLRRLLDFLHRPYPYPPMRHGEPLLRGIDPHMAYRRGPFALYTLGEYSEADSIDTALRRLLARHRQPEAPLATTLDLYAELEDVLPDTLHPLLHDLFVENTFWEFDTREATARRLNDDRWEVSLEVDARKVVADTAGVESEVPLDDWVYVGAVGQRAGEEPLYYRRHRIRSGEQTITFTLDDRPRGAGLDPYHLLDLADNEDDKNYRRVTVRE